VTVMRKGYVALMMLMSTAGLASAQQPVALSLKPEVKVTADDVVARLMVFDRNHDGKVALDELSERMQPLVVRGDRSGDKALDAAEIRALIAAPLPEVAAVPVNVGSGRYSFADTVGQTSRMRIDNSIEDLRLAFETTQKAKEIGEAFVDAMDETAEAHLRATIIGLLTPDQRAQFEADRGRLENGETIIVAGDTSPIRFMVTRPSDLNLLKKYALTPEQTKMATAAGETFKAEQQLDEKRQSALVVEMSSVMTPEECDGFGAALARRPLAKSTSTAFFEVKMIDFNMLADQLRAAQSALSSAR